VTLRPEGKQLKILIVDDNEKMRAFVHEALEPLQATIFEAEDGLEAMNVIEREKPALLIMDYQMPAWDGLEVCRQIRKQPGLQDIKVLMVTGHIVERELLYAVNFRLVDAALSKPVNLAELKQLIRYLLAVEPSLSGT